MGGWVGWLVGGWVGWLVGWLVGGWVGGWVGWLVGGWVGGWLVGWLVGVLLGCFARKIDGPGVPGGLIIYSISPIRTPMGLRLRLEKASLCLWLSFFLGGGVGG